MKDYVNAHAMAMIDFQFIEEALKRYISKADKLIQIQVSHLFPYRYDRKDVEKLALKRLLERYSKISNNTSLVKQIDKLTKKRNDLAHQGFLFTTEEQKDKLLLKNLIKDLDKLHLETKEIFFILTQEISVLGEHLK